MWCILLFLTSSDWQVVKIANLPSWCYQIKIGKVRNDGKNRVYVSSYSGEVFELEYKNGEWEWSKIGEGGKRMIAIDIGDGRGDGKVRVYGANEDGYVYEFSYQNGGWRVERLPQPEGINTSVKVGNGRGDGKSRVYVGGAYTPFKEYSWEGEEWVRKDITDGDRFIWPFDIGDGREDGVIRIYAPNWWDGNVEEYSWKNGKWEELTIPISETRWGLCRVVLGKLRLDNKNRIYFSGKRDFIYELSYSNGNWEYVKICALAEKGSRWGLWVGKIKGDGKVRLYSTGTNGSGIWEHGWGTGGWEELLIDDTTRASTDIVGGVGRDDDTFRLYVGRIDGKVYEITCKDPWVRVEEEKEKTTPLYVFPNPFKTKIKIYLKRNEKIHIYDVKGRLIKTITSKIWNGTNKWGEEVKGGVYFLNTKTRKIKVIKIK